MNSQFPQRCEALEDVHGQRRSINLIAFYVPEKNKIGIWVYTLLDFDLLLNVFV